MWINLRAGLIDRLIHRHAIVFALAVCRVLLKDLGVLGILTYLRMLKVGYPILSLDVRFPLSTSAVSVVDDVDMVPNWIGSVGTSAARVLSLHLEYAVVH